MNKTEQKSVIWANQFDNVANKDGHYKTTGPEIWQQTDGAVDGFICAVGSGGTLENIETESSAVWEEKDITFQNVSITLGSGDALVLASRGLTETINDSGSAYSRERLATTLRDAPDTRPTSLIRVSSTWSNSRSKFKTGRGISGSILAAW